MALNQQCETKLNRNFQRICSSAYTISCVVRLYVLQTYQLDIDLNQLITPCKKKTLQALPGTYQMWYIWFRRGLNHIISRLKILISGM